MQNLSQFKLRDSSDSFEIYELTADTEDTASVWIDQIRTLLENQRDFVRGEGMRSICFSGYIGHLPRHKNVYNLMRSSTKNCDVFILENTFDPITLLSTAERMTDAFCSIIRRRGISEICQTTSSSSGKRGFVKYSSSFESRFCQENGCGFPNICLVDGVQRPVVKTTFHFTKVLKVCSFALSSLTWVL